jgi:hypothetical protein
VDDLLADLGVTSGDEFDDAARAAVLVEAIRRRQLPAVLRALDAAGQPVDSELEACRAIVEETAAEQRRLAGLLADAGVPVTSPPVDSEDELLRLVRFQLTGHSTADAAVDALEHAGYRRWGPSTGGAWEAVKRLQPGVSLTRLDDDPTRVELWWRTPSEQSRIRKLLTPNEADYQLITLPRRLWPLYGAVRPLRLVAERIGLRSKSIQDLGPYLATPHDLAVGLVDLAGLGPDDMVVDLGCGDGRLLITAVQRCGCHARGVERDAVLVALANELVTEAGLTHKISIIHGDALEAELDDASVVLLFLPASVIEQRIGGLIARLRTGTRVLAHEQHAIRSVPAPVQVVPLITPGGVTVVSCWTA